MELQFKKIADYFTGERVDSYLIIKKADLKTTNSNGKKFLDFTLSDATGEINAKLWDVPVDMETMFEPNMLVKIRGMVTSYNNKDQLKIERIRKVVESDGVDPSEMVACAPIHPRVMFEEILNSYIRPMNQPDIRTITEKIFADLEEELMYYPAAKSNHHAIRSGLLYHILTMLKLGRAIVSIYPHLDGDLVSAGIILHDLCKIEEMDASELGIVRDYTVPGTLLGHISLGVENIGRVGRELGADEEIIMLLQHMILSHHYEPEYGSPVRPMFPEAELLHHIDIIDARMYDMKNIQDELLPGTLSSFIPRLDRRKIYKPNYRHQED